MREQSGNRFLPWKLPFQWIGDGDAIVIGKKKAANRSPQPSSS